MPSIISHLVDFRNTHLHETLIVGIHVHRQHEPMDTKIESGRRIKERRTLLKLKQREVCDLVPGLTITRLSNWEQGLRMLSVDEAKRLAPVLKTTAAYLLTIDDDPGDPRLQALVATYAKLDDRGKQNVQRVAESESLYVVSKTSPQDQAA